MRAPPGRTRFRYIHVDEYQDTNRVQYDLLRLLVNDSRNLCVVGDEDQSIYRWRGADIGNILRFEEDYPGARVVRLEENYRSTQKILDAAAGVVSNNRRRLGKNLKATRSSGKSARVFRRRATRRPKRNTLPTHPHSPRRRPGRSRGRALPHECAVALL